MEEVDMMDVETRISSYQKARQGLSDPDILINNAYGLIPKNYFQALSVFDKAYLLSNRIHQKRRIIDGWLTIAESIRSEIKANPINGRANLGYAKRAIENIIEAEGMTRKLSKLANFIAGAYIDEYFYQKSEKKHHFMEKSPYSREGIDYHYIRRSLQPYLAEALGLYKATRNFGGIAKASTIMMLDNRSYSDGLKGIVEGSLSMMYTPSKLHKTF